MPCIVYACMGMYGDVWGNTFLCIAVRFCLEGVMWVQWSFQHGLSAAVMYTSGIVEAPTSDVCVNWCQDWAWRLCFSELASRDLCQVDSVKHYPNKLWHNMWHVVTRTCCKNDCLWGCGRLILPIPGIPSRQSPWKCSTSLSSKIALTSTEKNII